MSLTGKQARLEGEPHTRDEHVAETDMVNRSLVNSRLPIITDIPKVVNRVWEQMSEWKAPSPLHLMTELKFSVNGETQSLHNLEYKFQA
jgi:hypothetical protein